MQTNIIKFVLNGEVKTLEVTPSTTLLEVIRDEYKLNGTKSVCNEGDCGACTVTISEYVNGKISYRAVNSCLYPAEKILNKHVITVEGLTDGADQLHPIQEILYNNYSTQCGFCTPGIVMSIFAYLAENDSYNEEDLKESLNGNLCRCTGYVHIIKGALEIIKYFTNNHDNLFPAKLVGANKTLAELAKINDLETNEQSISERGVQGYYLIKSLSKYQEVINKLSGKGTIKVISGGTDLYVVGNLRRTYFKNYLDISFIPGMKEIKYQGDYLVIGASTPLEEIRTNSLVNQHLPCLAHVASKMASKQIRNIASIGGNVGNASPVGDCATALIGLNARLILFGNEGERQVSIDQFYKGYKETVLKKHEFIKEIIIPLHITGYYNFEKSAKRKTLDISSVCSFAYIEHDNGVVNVSRFSFGGVAAYPKLALSIALEIRGKHIKDIDMGSVADKVADEFTPISDIRGSAEYRQILIRNHVFKHLYKFKMEVTDES
jgi:xanthine dehydrogenase small subunit